MLEVAFGEGEDVFVAKHGPLEDVLEVGVVGACGLVTVVNEDVFA